MYDFEVEKMGTVGSQNVKAVHSFYYGIVYDVDFVTGDCRQAIRRRCMTQFQTMIVLAKHGIDRLGPATMDMVKGKTDKNTSRVGLAHFGANRAWRAKET